MAIKKGCSLRVRLPEPYELALNALKLGGHVDNASQMVRACVRDKARECFPFEQFAEYFPREAGEEIQKQHPDRSKEEIARHVKELRFKFISNNPPPHDRPTQQLRLNWRDDN